MLNTNEAYLHDVQDRAEWWAILRSLFTMMPRQIVARWFVYLVCGKPSRMAMFATAAGISLTIRRSEVIPKGTVNLQFDYSDEPVPLPHATFSIEEAFNAVTPKPSLGRPLNRAAVIRHARRVSKRFKP
jgi:hypothetical protein